VKRIALVIPGIDRIGGAERQAMLLAKGLVRRGWQVSMVALSGTGGTAADELRAAGAAFLSLGMRKGLADPRGWIRFHRWLNEERPDVVHAHLPHAVWMARWSRLGVPLRAVVDTLHSSSTGGPGRRAGYRLSNSLTDRVTAVSDAAGNAHLDIRMVPDRKLIVVPNGVDVDAWRPDTAVREAVRRELGLTNGFLWFAAGRLEPVKDYPTLLRALAGTPKMAQLVIAGTGPLLGELTSLAKAFGLERRIRFLGFEPNVRRWMQAADGFVLSSIWEGLPMALLEAGACGVPAVATDVPGTREVVVDGVTGLLAPPGDADALRGTMDRLMETPPKDRRVMGERARQRVIAHYSLKEVLDRWEELYRDLLASNPVPRRWGRLD
jgi:glycosyltransferase involved in cell wall biosynthesis